jgi:hypothetical protein
MFEDDLHIYLLFFVLVLRTSAKLRVNAGFGQDLAVNLALRIHEALSKHCFASPHHCTQVNPSQLDERDQTLGANITRSLPHWWTGREGRWMNALFHYCSNGLLHALLQFGICRTRSKFVVKVD